MIASVTKVPFKSTSFRNSQEKKKYCCVFSDSKIKGI